MSKYWTKLHLNANQSTLILLQVQTLRHSINLGLQVNLLHLLLWLLGLPPFLQYITVQNIAYYILIQWISGGYNEQTKRKHLLVYHKRRIRKKQSKANGQQELLERTSIPWVRMVTFWLWRVASVPAGKTPMFLRTANSSVATATWRIRAGVNLILGENIEAKTGSDKIWLKIMSGRFILMRALRLTWKLLMRKLLSCRLLRSIGKKILSQSFLCLIFKCWIWRSIRFMMKQGKHDRRRQSLTAFKY